MTEMMTVLWLGALLFSLEGSSKRMLGNVVILQNKGGGHGTIGYALSGLLLKTESCSSLNLVQEHTNMNLQPFTSYHELEPHGLKLHVAKEGATEASITSVLSGQNVDIVVDNWSKTPEEAKLVLQAAKYTALKQFMYISSAGIYKPGNQMPLVESDSVLNKGTRLAETALQSAEVPYTIFRPQYIYGTSKISKRYLDYFIASAVEERPIPIPAPGDQLVCLTHIDDVASMIAAALDNPTAINHILNCGTDRYITYRGLCELVHQVVGNSAADCAPYVLCDPGDPVLEAFPFRSTSFITTPAKAKKLLAWTPQHRIEEDLVGEVQDYLFMHPSATTQA